MNRTRRAEDILTRLGERTGMTECGKNWVMASLDPFHDTPLELKGMPTGESSASVVQCIKQTTTITAPSGITTGTWDVSIVDWPWSTEVGLSKLYQQQTFQSSNPGIFGNTNSFGKLMTAGLIVNEDPVNTGGLCFYAGPTGAQMGINGVAGAAAHGGASYYDQILSLPDSYQIGKHRVVAKGFEVHNTTASLYKGGSVLCWRSPVADDTEMTTMQQYALNGSSSFAIVQTGVPAATCKIMDGPPNSPATALLLPNSKQWDAEAGCYCVSALHSTDVPAYEAQKVVPILNDPDYVQGSTPYQDGQSPYSSRLENTLSALGSAWLAVNTKCNMNQFDLNGAYFTGLLPQTVLTINYNIYVERFPTNSVPDLEVLANPAPERDNVALDFYTHAVRNLPVGVPVAMNGLGDWFKEAISTASNFIAPALSAIPHPYAQAGAALIRGVNGLANGSGAQTQPSTYQTVQQAEAPPPRIVERQVQVVSRKPYVATARERVARRQNLMRSRIEVRGMNRRRQANDNSKIRQEIRKNNQFRKEFVPRMGKGGVSFVV